MARKFEYEPITLRFTDRMPDGRKVKGLCFKSIVLRETDGVDEERAAEFAKARGGSASPSEELCRGSIVSVDDVEVAQPFEEFTDWNTKSRDLVFAMFQRMTKTPIDDQTAFFDAAHAPGEAGKVDADREAAARKVEPASKVQPLAAK